MPEEYKARNQILAGFESSLFWLVTINKYVGWINYIYYNQPRFINYTRDAIKGIAEQLDATIGCYKLKGLGEPISILDMLLAEKGSVCVMVGEKGCCTYIPNNTAPDVTITKALQGLTTIRRIGCQLWSRHFIHQNIRIMVWEMEKYTGSTYPTDSAGVVNGSETQKLRMHQETPAEFGIG